MWATKVSTSGKRVCVLCCSRVEPGSAYVHQRDVSRHRDCHEELEALLAAKENAFRAEATEATRQAGKLAVPQQRRSGRVKVTKAPPRVVTNLCFACDGVIDNKQELTLEEGESFCTIDRHKEMFPADFQPATP